MDFLVGEAGSPLVRHQVLDALSSHAEVERVSYLRTEWIGAERLYVVAAVALVGDLPESDVASRLAAIEDSLQERAEVVRAVLTLTRPDDPTVLTPEPLPDWYRDRQSP